MNKQYKQPYANGTAKKPLKIDIVGAGLVGALAALHLAKKGHEINLFEYRDDIRKSELVQGRSINLALSARGRAALAEVGLEDVLLAHGIPMKGRMLHDLKGNTQFSPYDAVRSECIYSVGRKHLNEILLNAGDKFPNIKSFFNHKLIDVNFEEGELTFKKTFEDEDYKSNSDLIIGCDGAYSAVRRTMLQKAGFNFSQEYIEHGYLELCIPPIKDEFAMPENYLHIWPRGKFMMIALPNQDKSWTVTLFMPFENFNSIKSPEDLLNFFEHYFPDSIPLIGKERLIKDFFRTKPQHLVSVKCYPYHIGSQALLLGDAAHAMVPFFGQGMNCGFEDCSILSELMNKEMNAENILKTYSEIRWKNAHTICDLAMYNYIEMRDLVTRRSFRIRKTIDNILFRIMPSLWLPLYNSVSFTRTPYKKCKENREWQDNVLRKTGATIVGVSFTLATFMILQKTLFSK